MKKIFLYCIVAMILLLPKVTKSQDSSTIQGLLQYIMQPLDKNQVGNGYLEEYGFPAVSMATFNGVLSANNRFELNSWRLMYFQLFTGWCRATVNPMTPISTVNNTIKSNTSPTLPTAIPILIGQYNNVKSNAFSSNLLSYNASQRKVYDVAGRTQNPYESKRLFAAVPVNQYSTDGSESFIYRSNMVWGNTSLTISQLQINFGNGAGLQTLTANTPVNINYVDTGAYVWTIRATLSDNSVVQCYSDYFVLAVPSAAQRFQPINITTPLWGNISPVAGVHSGATVNVIYSSKQSSPGTLRKPLIVVENMDVYNIAPSLQTSSYTISEFLQSINSTIQFGYDFNNQLDDIAGYDLVFIDFANGTDGIVRNAAVVQEAINRVNANKQFDNRSNRREQNVVMGIGTGGLHARYALANMTKNFTSTPTETRLLITHDAPHRGANIALGLQHLSRMLGNFSYFGFTSADIFPDYAETVALLNAPINVETLLYRATTDVANSPNTFMNTTYRSMVDFAPGAQPYQFVPTSLGNECARPLFTVGRLFMDFGEGGGSGVKAKLSVFGFTIVTIPIAELKFDCAVYASSIPPQAQFSREVARLNVGFKYVLFGLIEIKDKSSYSKSAPAPNTYLPIDGVPGSFNTILDFNELRNFQSSIGNWSFSPEEHLFDIPIYKKIVKLKFYAFVKAYANNSGVFTTQYTALPVGSALDVDPFNSSTFTEKYVNGFNPTFPSKGNTFIAQETNTTRSLFNNASMRFTARNARFLFNEMEQLPNTEVCSSECSNPFTLNGPAVVCTSNIFTIPNLPRGLPVTWSSSPLNIVDIAPSVNNTAEATVSRVSSGNVTVTATINACGQTALSKAIRVGGFSSSDYPVFGPNTLCTNATGFFNTYNLAGATNYAWFGGTIVSGQGTPNVSIQAPSTSGSMIVGVRVANSCDAGGSPGTKFVQVNTFCGNSFAVAPNPATYEVMVTLNEAGGTAAVASRSALKIVPRQTDIVQVRLLDKMGNLLKIYNYAKGNRQARINVSGLVPDIYVLKIFNGVNWEDHKIMVVR